MAEKRTMKLASAGKRLGAAVIDGIIPFIISIIGIAMVGSASNTPVSPDWGYGYEFEDEFGYGYGYGFEEQANDTAVLAAFGVVLLLLLIYFAFQCFFYAKSKSLGKTLVGLQVVSNTDGSPIGFWRMVFRELIVKQASHVLYLGFIWILIDDKNRAWHDKIMDTYVVDIKETKSMAARSAAPAPAPVPEAAAAPEAVPAPAPEAKPSVIDVDVEPVKAAPAKEAPKPAAPKTPQIRLDTDDAVITPATETASASAAKKAVKADMSMKKDELLSVASGLGLKLSSKATKAEIIEAIEKAAK